MKTTAKAKTLTIGTKILNGGKVVEVTKIENTMYNASEKFVTTSDGMTGVYSNHDNVTVVTE